MTMSSLEPDVSEKPDSPSLDHGINLESGQTGILRDTPADIGATSKEYESKQSYIQGLRLNLIIAAVCLCLFLTNLEIPIVTTALIGITDDLGGFSKASWMISAYLLGYVGVLIIFAKFSDIFGRKSMLLLAVIIFGVFSGACGAAQTIDQLIVFRAFQGIGGAGNYSISTVILMELVPSEKYAGLTTFVSVFYSLSLLLGPVLGGVISENTTWRWIFLLNVPGAALAALIIIFAMPNGFPHHGVPQDERPSSPRVSAGSVFQRLDLVGAILLLIATLFLVAALEEADVNYPWRSPFVITLLTISGICWMAFLLWSRRITLRQRSEVREPVFPWRFAQNRVLVGMLLSAIFLGGPWFCAIFQLPQRYQIVNSLQPLDAGVRLIPFTLAAPVGSIVSAVLAKAAKIPPLYLVIFAAVLQVIGFSLLSTIPESTHIIAAQYGYQIIAGFGCGINISLFLVMTPFRVQERDKAVALGSVGQFRVMGGVIGLAIITSAFNGLVRGQLNDLIPASELETLLKSPETISSFAQDVQQIIRKTFAEGYTLQIKILAGLAAGQIPAALLMWEKDQIRV
ncbi:hypothetical protein KVR01_012215 [Diaporthe batatas]|uniref:uncharacterized protein n=1 Tax=Diaporthe batatas TaxID=748121 RepID=UPI001D056F5E|nr:uncharacterized protein KVR01_012215 [Diaporthe batatas]KAG8157943.1 hypothetical protein KVR01_012215 [Diaporthe batatas]